MNYEIFEHPRLQPDLIRINCLKRMLLNNKVDLSS